MTSPRRGRTVVRDLARVRALPADVTIVAAVGNDLIPGVLASRRLDVDDRKMLLGLNVRHLEPKQHPASRAQFLTPGWIPRSRLEARSSARARP
jgi:hypothetical protein